MVSDTDMNMEESSTDDEMEADDGERENTSSGSMETSTDQGEEGSQSQTSMESAGAKAKSKSGGRRAALRILRENVDGVSKDLSSFRKTHEVSSKRLEKQVSSLRNEIASLKSYISKENAKARTKEEAYRNKILTKLNTQKAKAS